MKASMKKILLTVSGVALITASTFTMAGRGHMGAMLERMQEKLSLSTEQSEQVKAILQEQHAKKKALRIETDNRLKSVLNDEQVAKLEEMREKHEQWRNNKGKKGPKGDCGRR